MNERLKALEKCHSNGDHLIVLYTVLFIVEGLSEITRKMPKFFFYSESSYWGSGPTGNCSLTRDKTRTPYSESTESQPLDSQGSPVNEFL